MFLAGDIRGRVHVVSAAEPLVRAGRKPRLQRQRGRPDSLLRQVQTMVRRLVCNLMTKTVRCLYKWKQCYLFVLSSVRPYVRFLVCSLHRPSLKQQQFIAFKKPVVKLAFLSCPLRTTYLYIIYINLFQSLPLFSTIQELSELLLHPELHRAGRRHVAGGDDRHGEAVRQHGPWRGGGPAARTRGPEARGRPVDMDRKPTTGFNVVDFYNLCHRVFCLLSS